MSVGPANPYSPSYPVAPNLFAGRSEALDTLLRALDSTRQGHLVNVFLEGEWGIGKTSILVRLKPRLEERGPVVREDVVSGDQAKQFREFFGAVIDELAEVAQLSVGGSGQRETPRAVRRTLQELWERLKAQRHETVVLMLDNLERAHPEFLDDVRDVFQSLWDKGARYMLVFAGRELPVRKVSASNPTARFFRRLPIGPLPVSESLEAIRKPIEVLGYDLAFTDEAAVRIHERAAGHPYFLKAICSAVFETARGRGSIDSEWLKVNWPVVEQSLVVSKFGGELDDLSPGVRETLLKASLLGPRFEAKELRRIIVKSLDTHLSRLTANGLLRRLPGHGEYEIYHPLFRSFLQTRAIAQGMEHAGHLGVQERRPARGRDEVERLIQDLASRRLDVVDQHFRGRATSFLEAARADVRIRVLMAPDPAWPRTLRSLQELQHELRSHIEVRAWPETDKKPVPWHVRLLIGDHGAWEVSHSLDGVGRKATYFTDKSAVRDRLEADFERWWTESTRIFPAPASDKP